MSILPLPPPPFLPLASRCARSAGSSSTTRRAGCRTTCPGATTSERPATQHVPGGAGWAEGVVAILGDAPRWCCCLTAHASWKTCRRNAPPPPPPPPPHIWRCLGSVHPAACLSMHIPCCCLLVSHTLQRLEEAARGARQDPGGAAPPPHARKRQQPPQQQQVGRARVGQRAGAGMTGCACGPACAAGLPVPRAAAAPFAPLRCSALPCFSLQLP